MAFHSVLRPALLGIFLLAAPASAADLTPQEITDGWLMLFDGETTFGWKTLEGTLAVKDGKLVAGGAKLTRVEYPPLFAEGNMVLPATAGSKQSHLRVYFSDGTQMQRSGRKFELGASVPAGETCELSPMLFRPAGLKPIFNGKDLAGWKKFTGDPKREKSEFAVTADGELSVVNGPGDLQTVAEYADFVLQLECKTLGVALNSGVFLRGLPGQYQQGYEAQIQNAVVGTDRTKPLDYGTGAIYRRVAARKVVSNDNEWFTLTILAKGATIATWVNGYPVVMWTDERKPADNGRNGLKTAKGVISLQGHDPTTKLLFRNIRIAELPGK